MDRAHIGPAMPDPFKGAACGRTRGLARGARSWQELISKDCDNG